MKKIYDVVARRSLNHAKMLNPIMYLTIRCFFENFSIKAREDDYFIEFIERKLYVRNNWSTKQYTLFKEKNEKGFEYRDILSLSAFGIIAESYLMMKISESEYIKNKEYVYSYILSTRVDSSRNFEYYFTGYQKRNKEISKIFEENSTQIAIILDLTKFYPSIDKNQSKEIFLDALGKNMNSEVSILSEKISTSILEQSIKGVPIGTNLSHLIAQTYLSDFDEKLSNKFSNKYFRYVDDIVILCEKSERKEVEEYVSSILVPIGLKLNDTKTDIADAKKWALLNKNESENESLHDLLHFITAYLVVYPSKMDELSKQIKEAGYNIPLKKIEKQSKNRMFKLFIRNFMKRNQKYTLWRLYTTKPNEIVGKLLALKNSYEVRFRELLKLSYDNTNSAENRSNTQQLKYIINRLLYLSTIDELAEFIKEVPNTEKFNDTKEVIHALTTKDLKPSIQYGGKIIQTICELWIENDIDTIVLSEDYFKEILNINDVIDSIIILFLHKVVKFDIQNIVKFLDEENQEYLQVVLDSSYRVKDINNEFLLEIQGLLKGKDLDDKYNLLTTRYDDNEDISLVGLNLGLGYSL